MRGYDSHFIMQAIGEIANKHKNEKGEEKQMGTNVIPNNMENTWLSSLESIWFLLTCHHFTSPGLSWDAMLKMTDIKLGLIIDVH